MGALRRAKIDEKDRFLGIQADGAAATDIKPSEITVSGGAQVDNWVGPKTTAAFGKVLQNEDVDRLTTAFGRGLGLL